VAETIIFRGQKSDLLDREVKTLFSSSTSLLALNGADKFVHETDNTKTLLKDAVQALVKLGPFLTQKPALLDAVNKLIAFVESIQLLPRLTGSKLASNQLQLLEDMLFWIPTRFIGNINSDPMIMLLLAHLHAVALIVEPVSSMNLAYFINQNTASIESCYGEFTARAETMHGTAKERYKEYSRLMGFPLRTMQQFRALWAKELHQKEPYMALADAPSDVEGKSGHIFTSGTATIMVLQSCPVGLWHNPLWYD
jgi:hypothetical protein